MMNCSHWHGLFGTDFSHGDDLRGSALDYRSEGHWFESSWELGSYSFRSLNTRHTLPACSYSISEIQLAKECFLLLMVTLDL